MKKVVLVLMPLVSIFLACSKESEKINTNNYLNFGKVTSIFWNTGTRKIDTFDYDPTDWRLTDSWTAKEWALFNLDTNKQPLQNFHTFQEFGTALDSFPPFVKPEIFESTTGLPPKSNNLFSRSHLGQEFNYLFFRVINKKSEGVPLVIDSYSHPFNYYIRQLNIFYLHDGKADSLLFGQWAPSPLSFPFSIPKEYFYYNKISVDTLRIYYLAVTNYSHIKGHGDFVVYKP
jgi:hypothetical protein